MWYLIVSIPDLCILITLLIPTTKILFLGNWIDSVAMIVYLPEEKVQKIVSECKKLVSKCQATIRQVAKVLGLMVSCFPAVEYGPLFYRKLELAKIQALNINCGNYDAVMPVTSDMAQDLSWWIDNLKNQKRHISHGNPDMVITSDASLLGWGASSGQNKIGGRWKQMSSNFILTIWSYWPFFCHLKHFVPQKMISMCS